VEYIVGLCFVSCTATCWYAKWNFVYSLQINGIPLFGGSCSFELLGTWRSRSRCRKERFIWSVSLTNKNIVNIETSNVYQHKCLSLISLLLGIRNLILFIGFLYINGVKKIHNCFEKKNVIVNCKLHFFFRNNYVFFTPIDSSYYFVHKSIKVR